MAQVITSADTSINQLPAILRLVEKLRGPSFWGWKEDVLDYGGGRYDRLTVSLATRGIRNWIFDPFNRSEDHNKLVRQLLSVRHADVAFCSNVLNVIKSPFHRRMALLDIKFLIKPAAEVYFTVYEGDKSSKGRKTGKGWQAHRPTRNYVREIKQEFHSVETHGKLIVAREFK